MMNSIALFPIILKIMQRINKITLKTDVSENKDTLIERFLYRIEPNSYFKNLLSQTFKQDYYYFNTIIYILLITTIIVVIFKLIKKKQQSDKKYIYASNLSKIRKNASKL